MITPQQMDRWRLQARVLAPATLAAELEQLCGTVAPSSHEYPGGLDYPLFRCFSAYRLLDTAPSFNVAAKFSFRVKGTLADDWWEVSRSRIELRKLLNGLLTPRLDPEGRPHGYIAKEPHSDDRWMVTLPQWTGGATSRTPVNTHNGRDLEYRLPDLQDLWLVGKLLSHITLEDLSHALK